MHRILITLAILSTLLLIAAYGLGVGIGDPTLRTEAAQRSVSNHFLISLGGLVFATLVHAIVLTYFMGTTRWMEETTSAYALSGECLSESRSLKYRTVLTMVGCLLLLIATGATGAAADPASPVGRGGWGGLSSSLIHFLLASITLGLNTAVHGWECLAVARNGRLIEQVLEQVRTIRREKGLPV